MRRALLSIVIVGLTAACGSGGDSTPTTDSTPPTDPTPTTTPVDTDPPATTSAPTTDTPTTTTLDEEAATIAAVEQAAIDAYNAYHAAILDPSNPDLRAEIERTHSSGALEGVIEILDDLITFNQIAEPNRSGLEPTVAIVGAVRFTEDDRTRADLINCELNPERFVEVGAAPDGSNALVSDDVYTVRNDVEFMFDNDHWTFSGGVTIDVLVGDVGCE